MDLGFINRDKETYRGIDYNLFFADQINIGVPIDLSLNLTATKLVERSTLFTNPDGSVDLEGYKGEWGFPRVASPSGASS